MIYALVGFGKMGRAIDAAAAGRGHRRGPTVDLKARGRGVVRSIAAATWRGVAVAFEFTEPASAKDHVVALLRRGVGVVCGTTGWDASDPDVRRAARGARAGAVIAPNFSVGMNLFYGAVEEAARRYLAVEGYDPWVAEWHHRGKLDAPSGTAGRLAAIVAAGSPRGARVHGGVPGEPLPRGDVHLVAVRAGHEPGRHVVGFDGPFDAVTLSHAARGREGFAFGAVLAAEWIVGRRGIHDFGDVLDDLVSGSHKRGVRR
jgi:4-hydroxy-tetrahydrodipicolinate reductase